MTVNATAIREVTSPVGLYPPLTTEKVTGSTCLECGEKMTKGDKVTKVRGIIPPRVKGVAALDSREQILDPPPDAGEVIAFVHEGCAYKGARPQESEVPHFKAELPEPVKGLSEPTYVEEAQAEVRNLEPGAAEDGKGPSKAERQKAHKAAEEAQLEAHEAAKLR